VWFLFIISEPFNKNYSYLYIYLILFNTRNTFRIIIPMKKFCLIIFLAIPFHSFSQEWIKEFGHYTNDGILLVSNETYDRGILLNGYYINYLNRATGWIVKTDVNGETLWEKKVGLKEYGTHVYGTDTTSGGGLIICGCTTQFDEAGDPFTMKLNSCGEKEWCNIYKTPENFDWANEIHPVKDGGYICLMSFYEDQFNKRVWLFKLDQEGNTVWSNFYHRDTNYFSEQASDMIITSDSGYLISAQNYTEVVPGSGLYWPSPFWIKVDTSGNEEWECTWHQSDFLTGRFEKTIESKSDFYIGVGNNGFNPPSNMCIYKLYKTGDPYMRHDLLTNYYAGGVTTINFLQDSTLVLGGGYATCADSNFASMLITDTTGTMLHQFILPTTDGYAPNGTCITHDNKILVTNLEVIHHPTVHFVTYLYKFNSELEYDSIYTVPYQYDTLCPHPIVSDTIELDCWPVNVEDPVEGAASYALSVAPNPARSSVTVVIPETFTYIEKTNGFTITKTRLLKDQEITLNIYSPMGTKVKEVPIPACGQPFTIDVSAWSAGMYFFSLQTRTNVIGTAKVIVSGR